MRNVVNASKIGFLGLAILWSSVSHAQTVTSFVESDVAGTTTTDSQGPSATTVSSSLTVPQAGTLDFSDDGFGQATQRPSGVGGVISEALFANGGNLNSVVSRTTWSDTETNNSGAPTSYEFQYLITPARLRIGDFAGLEETDPTVPEISFEIVIRANGVAVFTAGATLRGGFVSHELIETGTSLNPSLTPNPLPPFTSVFGYDFGSRADTIDLGSVDDGQSITVEYEMTATVFTPGFEAGGLAAIGDPFDLDGNPGFTGMIIPGGPVATEDSSWGEVKSLYDR